MGATPVAPQRSPARCKNGTPRHLESCCLPLRDPRDLALHLLRADTLPDKTSFAQGKERQPCCPICVHGFRTLLRITRTIQRCANVLLHTVDTHMARLSQDAASAQPRPTHLSAHRQNEGRSTLASQPPCHGQVHRFPQEHV